MKIQSAAHGTDHGRTAQAVFHVSKENSLLAAGVTLAFAFVTACIFMLG